MQVLQLQHGPKDRPTEYSNGNTYICTVGAYSYAFANIVHWQELPNTLTIGNYCSIAAAAEFLLGGGHDVSGLTTYPFAGIDPFAADLGVRKPPESQNSSVGSDVWIGRRAMLLAGVNVGDGAIIGAGAVVTKDVGPYEVVVGNPAKVLRTRFTDDEIEVLLRVRWWDWPLEKVRKNLDVIMTPDVGRLLEVHEQA